MKRTKKKGFTLVEFILVIALSGIIFISLAQAVIITIRSFDIALAGSNLVGQTDVAFERMMREIRQMKDRTSLITATPTDIRFIDINNNDIEYKLQTNQLMRNANVAIDNATAMTIEYFDKYGALIAIPAVSPQNTNVRTVSITLTVASSSQSIIVRSSVRFRNVR